MEESIKDNLTSDIWDVLGLKSVSPRQLSPLVLAYIGDSIFDLVVKTKIVAAGNTQVNKMNSCLLYTSPSPRDRTRSRMPSSA